MGNIFEAVNGYRTGGSGCVKNLRMYNNVFKSTLDCPAGGPNHPYGMIIVNHEDALVKNNIFTNFKNAGISASGSTGTDCDYNLIWMSDSSSPSQYWRSGTGTSGSGDLANNTDPVFTSFNDTGGGSLNDYSLQVTTPCDDVGENLGATYDDILLATSSWPDSVSISDQSSVPINVCADASAVPAVFW